MKIISIGGSVNYDMFIHNFFSSQEDYYNPVFSTNKLISLATMTSYQRLLALGTQ